MQGGNFTLARAEQGLACIYDTQAVALRRNLGSGGETAWPAQLVQPAGRNVVESASLAMPPISLRH